MLSIWGKKISEELMLNTEKYEVFMFLKCLASGNFLSGLHNFFFFFNWCFLLFFEGTYKKNVTFFVLGNLLTCRLNNGLII
jgi:hypothetical protein